VKAESRVKDKFPPFHYGNSLTYSIIFKIIFRSVNGEKYTFTLLFALYSLLYKKSLVSKNKETRLTRGTTLIGLNLKPTFQQHSTFFIWFIPSILITVEFRLTLKNSGNCSQMSSKSKNYRFTANTAL